MEETWGSIAFFPSPSLSDASFKSGEAGHPRPYCGAEKRDAEDLVSTIKEHLSTRPLAKPCSGSRAPEI